MHDEWINRRELLEKSWETEDVDGQKIYVVSEEDIKEAHAVSLDGTFERMYKLLEELKESAQTIEEYEDSVFADYRSMAESYTRDLLETLSQLDLGGIWRSYDEQKPLEQKEKNIAKESLNDLIAAAKSISDQSAQLTNDLQKHKNSLERE